MHKVFKRDPSKSSPVAPFPNEDSFGRLFHKKQEEVGENISFKLLQGLYIVNPFKVTLK